MSYGNQQAPFCCPKQSFGMHLFTGWNRFLAKSPGDQLAESRMRGTQNVSGTSCGRVGVNSAAGSWNSTGRLALHQNQNELGFFQYLALICSSINGTLGFPSVIGVRMCYLQLGILGQQLLWDLAGEICWARISYPLRFWAPGVLRAGTERTWASLSLELVLMYCTKPFAFGLIWKQMQGSWTRGQPWIPGTVFPNWVTLQLRDSLLLEWEYRQMRMLCLEKLKWSRLQSFCHPVTPARKRKQRRKHLPCHPLGPDTNSCCLLPNLCPSSSYIYGRYPAVWQSNNAKRTCISTHEVSHSPQVAFLCTVPCFWS